jgi:hypothetical protein
MDAITDSLQNVKSLLQNFTFSEADLSYVFGEGYNRPVASTILTAWNNGDFGALPEIEIIDGNILDAAKGGYAISTNTIYISDSLVGNNSLEVLSKTLTEEIGHWFDAQINTVDPIWDEGEVFANLINSGRGERPFAPTANFDPEDDGATIYINGQAIYIEQMIIDDGGIIDIIPGPIINQKSLDLIGQWPDVSFKGVNVVDSYAYITNANGFLILDISDPHQPLVTSTFGNKGTTYNVEVVDNTAYYTSIDYYGLATVDVSNPATPSYLGSYGTSGNAYVQVVENTAYFIDQNQGLIILDVSNPSTPAYLGSYETEANTKDVEVVDNLAYILGSVNLEIVDVSNPSTPSYLGNYYTFGRPWSIEVVENVAYIINQSSLVIVDVSDPSTPSYLGSYNVIANDIEVLGNIAYMTTAVFGLVIVDVSNPSDPSFLTNYDTSGKSYDVEVVGNLAYLTDSNEGLLILDVSDYITEIMGTEASEKLTGNKLDNVIKGLAGNDTLIGGLGSDTLIGGLGNDTYIVDNIGDKVTEILDEGTDLIKSSINYTLPANVENITLTGSANLIATGNILANKLTGNAGNNKLIGKDGNDTLTGGLGIDTLIGGLGTDTLTGGGGKDIFLYNYPTEGIDTITKGIDTITDFNRAQGDKININRTNFKLTNLTAGALQNTNFVLGTTAKDSDDRLIFNPANNTLFFDSDGTGPAAQKAIALISNNLDLKASDIILV